VLHKIDLDVKSKKRRDRRRIRELTSQSWEQNKVEWRKGESRGKTRGKREVRSYKPRKVFNLGLGHCRHFCQERRKLTVGRIEKRRGGDQRGIQPFSRGGSGSDEGELNLKGKREAERPVKGGGPRGYPRQRRNKTGGKDREGAIGGLGIACAGSQKKA